MKIKTGNLLDIRAGTILHQVNCRGVVGGLAAALHHKYPDAFKPYFEACRRGAQFALGTFVHAEAVPGLFIGHVFGQLEPGANTDLSAVKSALDDATFLAPSDTVFAPYKMGCGIGGGDWDVYSAALVDCFPGITIVQRLEDVR